MVKLSPDNFEPSRGHNDPVAMILTLLGDVVLIPIYRLTKKPVGEDWQLRTRASMKDPTYLHSFEGKNIGVLLGEASGGLCTIDLDLDTYIERFLDKNPRLQDTLLTKRVRGGNFWVYIDGEFPASAKLKINGKTIGEWRANGNQTVIYGRAIDKRKGETEPTEYKFLNEVQPIHIRFDEIVFPDGCYTPKTYPLRLNSASCNTTSLHDCIPASLHNTADSVFLNIEARKKALASISAKHPNLVVIYTGLIEPRYRAQAHARNDFIVQAVPFLYRVVAQQFVLELIGCFYDCNRALFNDPREQHMKEAKAMLESVAKTYSESLNEGERRIYDALSEQEQVAFRVCRDLAQLPEPEREPLTFFLSFQHLAYRLGIFPMQAQRIMRQLESYGLIKLLKKGTRRAIGVRGEAGIYRWQLSLIEK